LFIPYRSEWIYQKDMQKTEKHRRPSDASDHSAKWWVSESSMPTRTQVTAGVGITALLAMKYGLDTQAPQIAKKSLEQIEENHLRHWCNFGDLPEELQPLTNLFAPEAAGTWLVAYWMGRSLGQW
jgi:hypothetical protein